MIDINRLRSATAHLPLGLDRRECGLVRGVRSKTSNLLSDPHAPARASPFISPVQSSCMCQLETTQETPANRALPGLFTGCNAYNRLVSLATIYSLSRRWPDRALGAACEPHRHARGAIDRQSSLLTSVHSSLLLRGDVGANRCGLTHTTTCADTSAQLCPRYTIFAPTLNQKRFLYAVLIRRNGKTRALLWPHALWRVTSK